MTLHMVVGAPCSGKSTYVETHAPPGTPRWDFDRVADLVAGQQVAGDVPQPVAEVVLAMRRGLLGWLLDGETVQGGDVWVINTAPSTNTINKWVAAGGVFHVIDPGESETLARAVRQGRSEATLDAIKAWYLSPPEIPDNYRKGAAATVKLKDMTVQVKAGEDGQGEGEMIAYASVFDNVDRYGDVIRKGAFADTIKEWQDGGNTLPLLYGHDFGDPFSNIGAVTKAVEDDHGLKVTAKLDLDNPKAAQVYRLLKEKRLSQMSFAFDVLEGGEIDLEGKSAYEIRKVNLYEASVVPIGANPETSIVSVKMSDTAGFKSEDVGGLLSEISAKLDTLAERVDKVDPPAAAVDPPAVPNYKNTVAALSLAVDIIHMDQEN